MIDPKQWVRRWSEQLGCTVPEALTYRLQSIEAELVGLLNKIRAEEARRWAFLLRDRASELEAWHAKGAGLHDDKSRALVLRDVADMLEASASAERS
jgi:hypothetical protein